MGYLQGRSRNPPPEWNDIELARMLNHVLGVTTITPWNIGQIPEHWIELVVKGKQLEQRMHEQGLI